MGLQSVVQEVKRIIIMDCCVDFIIFMEFKHIFHPVWTDRTGQVEAFLLYKLWSLDYFHMKP